jgi:hypothetical protein
MTPKEKASEIQERYYQLIIELINVNNGFYYSKHCALIAVDELIKSTPTFDNKHFFDEGASEYWQEVKQEIEKL